MERQEEIKNDYDSKKQLKKTPKKTSDIKSSTSIEVTSKEKKDIITQILKVNVQGYNSSNSCGTEPKTLNIPSSDNIVLRFWKILKKDESENIGMTLSPVNKDEVWRLSFLLSKDGTWTAAKNTKTSFNDYSGESFYIKGNDSKQILRSILDVSTSKHAEIREIINECLNSLS